MFYYIFERCSCTIKLIKILKILIRIKRMSLECSFFFNFNGYESKPATCTFNSLATLFNITLNASAKSPFTLLTASFFVRLISDLNPTGVTLTQPWCTAQESLPSLSSVLKNPAAFLNARRTTFPACTSCSPP